MIYDEMNNLYESIKITFDILCDRTSAKMELNSKLQILKG